MNAMTNAVIRVAWRKMNSVNLWETWVRDASTGGKRIAYLVCTGGNWGHLLSEAQRDDFARQGLISPNAVAYDQDIAIDIWLGECPDWL